MRACQEIMIGTHVLIRVSQLCSQSQGLWEGQVISKEFGLQKGLVMQMQAQTGSHIHGQSESVEGLSLTLHRAQAHPSKVTFEQIPFSRWQVTCMNQIIFTWKILVDPFELTHSSTSAYSSRTHKDPRQNINEMLQTPIDQQPSPRTTSGSPWKTPGTTLHKASGPQMSMCSYMHLF